MELKKKIQLHCRRLKNHDQCKGNSFKEPLGGVAFCSILELVKIAFSTSNIPDFLFCYSRSCPECRVISEFVIPSVYWVEDQTKKNELIEAFKQGVG